MASSRYEFKRNIAVIIGINEYSNGIPLLKTAVPDAIEFARILKEDHKYDIQLLLDKKATLNELLQLFSAFEQRTILVDGETVDVDDSTRILFYFAGHGIAQDGLENEEGPTGFLVPQDAKPDNVKTFLPMQVLHDALTYLPCRHLLTILDCCFAGAFRWSSLKRNIIPSQTVYKERYERFIRDPAWQAITSAAHDQKAVDILSRLGQRGEIEGHSPFAISLYTALSRDFKADLNKDGVITATELYCYLRDEVEITTEKYYKLQTPGLCQLKKHNKGEYIFLVPNYHLNLPDAPPLNRDNNPYRGLEPFEEEHKNLFFGREQLVKELYKRLHNPNHSLTVVVGASGIGKSSLVKAGLIPQLRSSTEIKWYILPPIRLRRSPFTSLAEACLLLTNSATNDEILHIDPLSRALQQKNKQFDEIVTAWNSANPQMRWFLISNHFEELLTFGQQSQERQLFWEQVEIVRKNYTEQRNKLSEELRQRSEKFHEIIANWCSANFDTKLLLVIDQFEELVTTCQHEEEQRQFIELLEKTLQSHKLQLCVVLTLRSDFEPQFLASVLEPYWMASRFIVPPMTQDELRAAIEKPATERVLYFESDNPNTSLIDRLINEVVQMPGGLPLLSFTLSELYLKYLEHRGNNRALTEADYQQLGGVVGSLQKRATQEYEELLKFNPGYEITVRRVMLRMVTIEGGESVRRRVPRRELQYSNLEENERVEKVIQHFTAARLIVGGWEMGGEAYVEPAHDALVRGWSKLQKWKNEFQEYLALQTRLTAAANDWLNNHKNVGFLWASDPRLEQLKQVVESQDNWLNQVEMQFFYSSQAQQAKEEQERQIAISRQLAAKADFVYNQRANLLQRSVLLAVEAMHKYHTLEADLVLRSGLALLPETVLCRTYQDDIKAMVFRPDGQYIATAGKDCTAKIWNAVNGQLVLTVQHSKDVYALTFSLDGCYLATASKDGTAQVWDTINNQLVTCLHHEEDVLLIRFSPDGQHLATVSNNHIAYVWSIATGQAVIQIQHKDTINDLAFSPNGHYVASASNDDTVYVWEVTNNRQVTCINHQGDVKAIAFNPTNENLLATVVSSGFNNESAAYLWEIPSGCEITPCFRHDKPIVAVAFSPDGQYLATGCQDNRLPGLPVANSTNPSARIWEITSRREISRMEHDNTVHTVTFSSNGKYLATACYDGTARVWEANSGQEVSRIVHDGVVNAVTFQPKNEEYLATASQDHTMRLWKLTNGHEVARIVSGLPVIAVAFNATGEFLATAGGHISPSGVIGVNFYNPLVQVWKVNNAEKVWDIDHKDTVVNHIAFSSNGKCLATASQNGTVRRWWADNIQQTPQELPQIIHKDSVWLVTFSTDSKYLATASEDCTTRVWEAFGNQEFRCINHDAPVWSVSFSHDGKYLATGCKDGSAQVWELVSRQRTQYIHHQQEVNSVAFNPLDNKILATASYDGIARLWDLISGKEVKQMFHQDRVNVITFSPDGQHLMTVSCDGTARVWEVSSGREVARLERRSSTST